MTAAGLWGLSVLVMPVRDTGILFAPDPGVRAVLRPLHHLPRQKARHGPERLFAHMVFDAFGVDPRRFL